MTTAVSPIDRTEPDDDGADNDSAPREIAVLEARIEHLSARAERCRKVMRISRLTMAAGVVALLAMIVGVLRFEPSVFVVALAAALGGFPLSGSTNSTLHETLATLREAEGRRRDLIDALALEAV